MNVAPRASVNICCHGCYRMSPSKEGPLERAQREFRDLGWMWRLDGRVLCPICNARESTMPPPPPAL